MLLTQDGRVRDRLIAYIEHKLDLTRPDEITENTNKGYNQTLKYSNGLELRFLTCTVTWVFLVDMSGDTLRNFAQKDWTIGSSERGLGH